MATTYKEYEAMAIKAGNRLPTNKELQAYLGGKVAPFLKGKKFPNRWVPTRNRPGTKTDARDYVEVGHENLPGMVNKPGISHFKKFRYFPHWANSKTWGIGHYDFKNAYCYVKPGNHISPGILGFDAHKGNCWDAKKNSTMGEWLVDRVKMKSARACASACASNPKCTSFVWQHGGGDNLCFTSKSKAHIIGGKDTRHTCYTVNRGWQRRVAGFKKGFGEAACGDMKVTLQEFHRGTEHGKNWCKDLTN